jgi:cytochrome d ubiquinol oxidase subunit II
MTIEPTFSFYDRFIAPWLSLFPLSLGIFITILFAYLAAIYLIGEPADGELKNLFKKYAFRLMAALGFTGLLVFLTASIDGLPLVKLFLKSWISISCVVFTFAVLPVLYLALKKNMKNLLRIVAGAQTGAVLIGWFSVQLPVLVVLQGGRSLTIYNTVAAEKSVLMMVIALCVGLAIVIPLLLYLFRVFKFSLRG